MSAQLPLENNNSATETSGRTARSTLPVADALAQLAQELRQRLQGARVRLCVDVARVADLFGPAHGVFEGPQKGADGLQQLSHLLDGRRRALLAAKVLLR